MGGLRWREDRRRLLLERQINLLARRRRRGVRNDPWMRQEGLLYEGLPWAERIVEHPLSGVVQPEDLERLCRARVHETYRRRSVAVDGFDVPFVAARLRLQLLNRAELIQLRRGLHRPGLHPGVSVPS